MDIDECKQDIYLAVGAEGTVEEAGAVQYNLPWILHPDFICADGKGTLSRIAEAGPVVVGASTHLPYANAAMARVIARNVPVCRGGVTCPASQEQRCPNPPQTHMGPVYCLYELMRVLRAGGELDVGSICWVTNVDAKSTVTEQII